MWHRIRRRVLALFRWPLWIARGRTSWIRWLLVVAPNQGAGPAPEETHPWILRRLRVRTELFVAVGGDGERPATRLRVRIVDPPRGRLRGTVLLLHGYRFHSTWLIGKAWSFAKAGYRCVLPDLRGHGGSPGDWITWGVHDAVDLSEVLDRLVREDLVVGRLGVWGWSMGAAAGILLGARDARPAAIVAVTPYPSYRTLASRVVRLAAPPRGLILRRSKLKQVIEDAAAEAGFHPEDADVIAAARTLRAPLLTMISRVDVILPPSEAKKVHAAAAPPKELLSLGFTGHVLAGLDPFGRVRRESIRFFRSWLAPPA